ncbi:unnamed protein product [Urochloa decumbens]|uniref:Uncharacterized protein n=1 Tax=Urochloa decumbens TaxID=240449 RepID=A0ABC9FTN7_9POAL
MLPSRASTRAHSASIQTATSGPASPRPSVRPSVRHPMHPRSLASLPPGRPPPIYRPSGPKPTPPPSLHESYLRLAPLIVVALLTHQSSEVHPLAS